MRLPTVPLGDELEEAEPEEIVVRVTDDRVIVIAAPSETKPSRWGRLVSDLTRSELASLLPHVDSATKALIVARRWTGSLVELHPTDRAKLSSDTQVVREVGGWIQANIRHRGQFARVMRIRPATGVATLAGGAFILAAIAAQAQAEEMARDIKAIRQRVDDIYKHLQDDQIGAVENAVEQVEDLVERLRKHGSGGVTESELSVVRNSLGHERRRCMQHLKTAVTKLEKVNQESPRQAEKILSKEAAEEVMLYLDLLRNLYAATVQFGLAQVAFDSHEGNLEVARTRAEQLAKSIAKFRAEIEDVCGRFGQLDQSVRAKFLPWWKHAIKEIPAKVGIGTVAGAVAPVAARVVDLGGDSGSDDGVDVEPAGKRATLLGAAVGGLGGLGLGSRNLVAEVRAQKPLDDRLGQLTEASSRSSETMDQVAPSLEVLRTLTAKLAGPGE